VVNEVAIDSFVAHQLVRRTVLDDVPGLQYEDAVETSCPSIRIRPSPRSQIPLDQGDQGGFASA
jgi:hypothetical protein